MNKASSVMHLEASYAGSRACAHLDILISPAGEVIDALLAHEGTCHFPTPCPFAMPYGRVDARIAAASTRLVGGIIRPPQRQRPVPSVTASGFLEKTSKKFVKHPLTTPLAPLDQSNPEPRQGVS